MPGSDPVTAGFNALAEALGLGRDLFEKHEKEKYETEHQERIIKLSRIMLETGSNRAADLDVFVRSLLAKAGSAGGIVSSESIAIPLHDFIECLVQVSEGIRDAAYLQSAIRAAQKK